MEKMDDKLIEDAIVFLVAEYSKSGHNFKPVILHSIKVGMILYELGYDTDIVVSGILHDLIEDSSVTKKEIEQNFGIKIASIIEALTFNEKIEDKMKQYLELFNGIKKSGIDVILVKTADFIDNSNYYDLSRNEEELELMVFKTNHFLENTKEIIGNEKIWKILKRKMKKYSV